MGKKLIIKGADFSQNAINTISTTWVYQSSIERSAVYGIGTGSMANNNPWGYGPYLNSSVSGINIVRLILSSNTSVNLNIGKNYSLTKIKIGATTTSDTILANMSFTQSDMNAGYKDVVIPETNLAADETIAFMVFDKQNQGFAKESSDNVCYLPLCAKYGTGVTASSIYQSGKATSPSVQANLDCGLWLGIRTDE